MNKTITRTFDEESNKRLEKETINNIDEYIITKEHVTLLSKDNTNSMHNDTVDNQDSLNYS